MLKIATALVATTMLVTALGTPSFAPAARTIASASSALRRSRTAGTDGLLAGYSILSGVRGPRSAHACDIILRRHILAVDSCR